MKTRLLHLTWTMAALSLLPSWAGTDPAPPAAPLASGFWTQSTLTGDWNGERQKLIDHGLTITPGWSQEIFGNPTGGLRQGVVGSGELDLALDADTSKFTGWAEGGLFHANFYYLYGPDLDDDVGDFSTVSNITGYNTFRMQDCWYQQPFWGQHGTLKIGWIAVDDEFFLSTSGALFINGTFGSFPFLGLNDPYNPPVYPLAAPGLRLNLKPTDKLYLQAGVFAGNNGSQTQNKNGLDFRLNGASGLFVMGEIGYLLNQGPNDKGLSGTYKLGTFVHTGPFQTWNSKTGNALSGNSLDEESPDYGIYGVIDQQIYKEDCRTISLFLRPGYAPANINIVNPYLDGGINFTGFIPGRDKDILGIAAARSWITGSYNHYNQTVNDTPTSSSETVIEATYSYQVCPWCTIQPDCQYILQPGGATTSNDALILGCRCNVLF